VRGFFAELLQRIPVEALQQRFAAEIDARLARSGA